jgi:hypothetical protein
LSQARKVLRSLAGLRAVGVIDDEEAFALLDAPDRTQSRILADMRDRQVREQVRQRLGSGLSSSRYGRSRMCRGGVRVLVGAAVFKTDEAEDLGLAGSIPVLLRHRGACRAAGLHHGSPRTSGRRCRPRQPGPAGGGIDVELVKESPQRAGSYLQAPRGGRGASQLALAVAARNGPATG